MESRGTQNWPDLAIGLYDKLTGREFLHFMGRMYDVPPASIILEITESLAIRRPAHGSRWV